jgi:hypothetical protein
MNMKRYLGLSYFMLLGLLVQGQSAWQTRFVFEFFRDDTSLVKTYDTLWIGLDARGDKGFQDSLDVYIDSSENIHAYFVDTAFYEKFQGKKLVKDIRRFPDKVGETSFWCYLDKAPTTIYYDTNTIQLYIPPYLTSIGGEGPKGSSIGAWHADRIIFMLLNLKNTRKIPSFDFIEVPDRFFFKFTIDLYDSIKVGLENRVDIERISFEVSQDVLSISGLPQVNHAQLVIRDMAGKTIMQVENLSFEDRLEVPIEELPKGIYIVSLQTHQNYIYKKIYKP